jgi:hypothetical protein
VAGQLGAQKGDFFDIGLGRVVLQPSCVKDFTQATKPFVIPSQRSL